MNQAPESERCTSAQGGQSVCIAELVDGSEKFARLTYPRFASLLAQPRTQIAAIGAVSDGLPIGLALARFSDTTARLLSINIEPAWRERRIGTRLLTACENALALRGVQGLIANHSSRTTAREAFERLLASAGWHGPELVSLRGAACCGPLLGQLEAFPPMHRLLAQKQYACTPLTEIDEQDREVIKSLCQQPACRNCPALRQENWPDEVEPATSLVLRRDKRLVGWVVTERQRASARDCPSIHCSAAYIDMALSHTGALLIAYYHMYARQLAIFGPMSVIRCETPLAMRGMFAFIRRRFAPVALSVDEVFLSQKRLAKSD